MGLPGVCDFENIIYVDLDSGELVEGSLYGNNFLNYQTGEIEIINNGWNFTRGNPANYMLINLNGNNDDE